MPAALINGTMLRWARERAGVSIEAVAERLSKSPDDLAAWERGDAKPTFRQAQALASALHVPFGFLFLTEPPAEPRLPDFRRLSGERDTPRFDANTLDLIRDVLFKHDWYKQILIEEGDEPLGFVGRFGTSDAPSAVADDMRSVLGLMPDHARRTKGQQEWLRDAVGAAETARIWVMKSGVVGNSTRRTLAVAAFRGFAIADPIAPLVFVNGNDATAAQIFTFAHELAHIWLGSTGISDVVSGLTRPRGDVESFCNQVAAEFLLPSRIVVGEWSDRRSASANVDALATSWKVSRIVAAKKALDLDLIERAAFESIYEQERARWAALPKNGVGGGNFHATLPVRFGRRFTEEVVRRAMSGDTLLRDAGALLNTKPRTIVEHFRRASPR
ncbi:XRE family transcriptional regulator [Salinarimonas sp.]|uniref:XRE family transcriptional regulator n=1 Tax=Salinarimonas sp. TaxID=2766526 RepID=UPI0032D99A97